MQRRNPQPPTYHNLADVIIRILLEGIENAIKNFPHVWRHGRQPTAVKGAET